MAHSLGTVIAYKGYTLTKKGKTYWIVSKGDKWGYTTTLKNAKLMAEQKLEKEIERLKCRDDYSFECNMSKEYKTYKQFDEWGSAFLWVGDISVEYNFCIDGGVNYCAIYPMKYNEETEYAETDYSNNIHYEINFNEPMWEYSLENAMCGAIIELFKLQEG